MNVLLEPFCPFAKAEDCRHGCREPYDCDRSCSDPMWIAPKESEDQMSTDRPCPNCGTRNDATAFLCKVCWQSMGYLRSFCR